MADWLWECKAVAYQTLTHVACTVSLAAAVEKQVQTLYAHHVGSYTDATSFAGLFVMTIMYACLGLVDDEPASQQIVPTRSGAKPFGTRLAVAQHATIKCSHHDTERHGCVHLQPVHVFNLVESEQLLQAGAAAQHNSCCCCQ
jgi:hypothetical protein